MLRRRAGRMRRWHRGLVLRLRHGLDGRQVLRERSPHVCRWDRGLLLRLAHGLDGRAVLPRPAGPVRRRDRRQLLRDRQVLDGGRLLFGLTLVMVQCSGSKDSGSGSTRDIHPRHRFPSACRMSETKCSSRAIPHPTSTRLPITASVSASPSNRRSFAPSSNSYRRRSRPAARRRRSASATTTRRSRSLGRRSSA